MRKTKRQQEAEAYHLRQEKRKAAGELIRKMAPKKLMKVVNGLDGHGIFDPAWLQKQGMPADVVDAYTTIQKSDMSHPKGMIFDEKGNVLASLKGVYGLDLLYGIADALDVKYTSCIGRGFQARAIQGALEQHFRHQVPPKKVKA